MATKYKVTMEVTTGDCNISDEADMELWTRMALEDIGMSVIEVDATEVQEAEVCDSCHLPIPNVDIEAYQEESGTDEAPACCSDCAEQAALRG